ncbi:hypothetical protein NX779_03630 [Mycoplasma cottewii]|uniref:Uncharacterized protein n=1 Tax=Mycoplasma cottewii TaxID=51364 RepID=A0ABY5TZ37_9MOLU|nr:hypothetical protein [Mycoplasma cottewii]UWD34871.1 hypothetical protein NX779_03630 [Mycoplasma cottewii]
MKLKKIWAPISFLITAVPIGYAIVSTDVLNMPLFPAVSTPDSHDREYNRAIVTERFNNVKSIVEDILKDIDDNEKLKKKIPQEAINWFKNNKDIIEKIDEKIPNLDDNVLRSIRSLSDIVFEQDIFTFIRDEKKISKLVDDVKAILDRNGIKIDGILPNAPSGSTPSTT